MFETQKKTQKGEPKQRQRKCKKMQENKRYETKREQKRKKKKKKPLGRNQADIGMPWRRAWPADYIMHAHRRWEAWDVKGVPRAAGTTTETKIKRKEKTAAAEDGKREHGARGRKIERSRRREDTLGQAPVYERREAGADGNERSKKMRHRKGSQQICARCTEKYLRARAWGEW